MLVIRKSSDDEQVELARPAPRRARRTSAGRLLGRVSSARHRRVGSEQVAQEVLVALARGAEQVRPPDRQHAGQVLRGVRDPSHDEAQPPGLKFLRPRSRPGSSPDRPSGVGEIERVAVEGGVRRRPSEPRGLDDAVGQGSVAEQPAAERRGKFVRAEARRSATGRSRRYQYDVAGHLPGRPHPVKAEGELRPAGERPAPSPGRRSAPSRRR